ncbi:heparin lyase I family protein [Candidatus Pelagibacter sp. HIMB1493]|uniref:heparin lyase I family protein n=1 Tax=Candidatus Pelagibacter sp. HIMB1493 TaxID=3413334 RepID=UPI003F840DFF
MIKLLKILLLGLMFGGNAFSFGLPKDVGSGNSYTKSLGSGFKKHGVRIVKKEDGFPVRAGEKSVRFEVRFGDCGKDKPPGKWSDCKKDRQRHELSGKKFKGEKWTAFSIYLPKDFKSVDPVKLAMGQFHQKGGSPNLMFQFNNYGFWADRQRGFMTIEQKLILPYEDMIGKWNDILIHGNFTKKEDGFFKIWVNNKLKYEYYGQTTWGKPSFFKFGIYHTYVSRFSNTYKKPYPTQVVYFDEIRHGNSREKVVKDLY